MRAARPESRRPRVGSDHDVWTADQGFYVGFVHLSESGRRPPVRFQLDQQFSAGLGGRPDSPASEDLFNSQAFVVRMGGIEADHDRPQGVDSARGPEPLGYDRGLDALEDVRMSQLRREAGRAVLGAPGREAAGQSHERSGVG